MNFKNKIFNSIKVKYLEINLQKGVNNFYTESHKILLREIKEDLNKMEVYTISQIRILNILKKWFLPGLIHGFNELPIKIPLGIAADNDKVSFKDCLAKNSKTILKRKETAGGFMLPVSKTYYKATK